MLGWIETEGFGAVRVVDDGVMAMRREDLFS